METEPKLQQEVTLTSTPVVTLPAVVSLGRNDMFCWICHVKQVDYKCSSCPRSYHKECVHVLKHYPTPDLKSIKGEKILERCQECMVSDVTALKKLQILTTTDLITVLTGICQRWIQWLEQYGIKEHDYKIIQSMCELDFETYMDMTQCRNKIVDMNMIRDSVAGGDIRTMEGFVAQMKWIYHNSVIFNGSFDPLTEKTGEFMKLMFTDIDTMMLTCVQCNLQVAMKSKDRDPKFFIVPCQIPHPVVWAKVRGFPWWPAKLMTTNPKKDDVDVLFFGQYSRATVKLTDCRTFSHAPVAPFKKGDTKSRSSWNLRVQSATKEANDYIAALTQNGNIGPQLVNDNASPISKMTPDFIKTMFPHINSNILEAMFHLPTLISEMVIANYKQKF